MLIGCATVPITGRRQLSIVSRSEILSISAENYNELISKAVISKDEKDKALVTAVGKRIAKAAELFLTDNGLSDEIQDYNWEFNVIDDDETINAACLPGGKIVVYSGIIPVAENEEGLAVVLGHEVAHAIAKHGAERVSQQIMLEYGREKLSQVLAEKSQKTQDIIIKSFGLGTSLGVLMPYSRLHEREADRIGLILMARAGYDPRSAVPFWERMQKLGGGEIPEFLSTHPATQNRIDTIESLLPEALEYYSD